MFARSVGWVTKNYLELLLASEGTLSIGLAAFTLTPFPRVGFTSGRRVVVNLPNINHMIKTCYTEPLNWIRVRRRRLFGILYEIRTRNASL
jgi:hypothetical protein